MGLLGEPVHLGLQRVERAAQPRGTGRVGPHMLVGPGRSPARIKTHDLAMTSIASTTAEASAASVVNPLPPGRLASVFKQGRFWGLRTEASIYFWTDTRLADRSKSPNSCTARTSGHA